MCTVRMKTGLVLLQSTDIAHKPTVLRMWQSVSVAEDNVLAAVWKYKHARTDWLVTAAACNGQLLPIGCCGANALTMANTAHANSRCGICASSEPKARLRSLLRLSTRLALV